MTRIFLTHPPEALKNYYGERALLQLRSLAEVRTNASESALDTDALIAAARDCEIIVSGREAAGAAALFASAPSLVAFVRCAVDIRNVDVAAASAAGVLVTHASAGFVPAVTEWIVGAMIALSRRIVQTSEAYHAGDVPAAAMGVQLHGATLGVIGYGQIGRYLCQVAATLGMHVLVHDPYAQAEGEFVNVGLQELLKQADFVVCLAVANEETEGMMSAGAFACMKPAAYFINAARGNLVDESALEAALDAGRIAGCALDVGRAPDQMPTPALARRPKVIATPHVGGLTPTAIEHQALETVAQVSAILHGRAPKGAVNASAAARLGRMMQPTGKEA